MLSSLFLLSSSTTATATSLILSLSRTTLSLARSSCRLEAKIRRYSCRHHCHLFTTMSISLQSHAFAGNPIRSKTPKSTDPSSPNSALESLKTLLLDNTHQPSSPSFKVLPFRKGRPLASSSSAEPTATPVWHLGWISLGDCKGFLANSEVTLSENSLVYLGYRSEDDVVNWAIDVSGDDGLVSEFGKRQFCFVELRTLMVATNWDDARAMGDLAIAGHGSWTTCKMCMLKSVLCSHQINKIMNKKLVNQNPSQCTLQEYIICSLPIQLMLENYNIVKKKEKRPKKRKLEFVDSIFSWNIREHSTK